MLRLLNHVNINLDFFSKRYLLFDNSKLSSSKSIALPSNFYHFTKSKSELIEKMTQNCKTRIWLSERGIFAAKSIDGINKIFQIDGKLMT